MDVVSPNNISITIFLSYSRVDTAIVDDIYFELSEYQLLEISRDIFDVKYKDEIDAFMRKVRSHNYTILVLSDAYLRSYNCMLEVVQLLNSNEFDNKYLPIILSDANNIHKGAVAEIYVEFWNSELEVAKKRHLSSPTNALYWDEHRNTEKIRACLGDFFSIISRYNNLDQTVLKNSGYRQLFRYIVDNDPEKLSEVIASKVKKVKDKKGARQILLSVTNYFARPTASWKVVIFMFLFITASFAAIIHWNNKRSRKKDIPVFIELHDSFKTFNVTSIDGIPKSNERSNSNDQTFPKSPDNIGILYGPPIDSSAPNVENSDSIDKNLSSYIPKGNKPFDRGKDLISIGDGAYVTRDSINLLLQRKLAALASCFEVLVERKQNYNDAIDFGMYLFNYDDSVTVEALNPKSNTVRSYRIREYLQRIHYLPYESIRINESDIRFVGGLYRHKDGTYHGNALTFESFVGQSKHGRIVCASKIKKDFKFNLKVQTQEIEGIVRKKWTIFLSDIKVTEHLNE